MFGIGEGITAAMNWKIAKEQMQFQERMSSTAFQRQMADMKDAGLNPMLAKNMGGATTPPGAAIPVDFKDSFKRHREATSGAQLLKQQVSTEKQRTRLTRNQAELAETQSMHQLYSAKKVITEDRLLRFQEPGAEFRSKYDQTSAGKFFNAVHKAGIKIPGFFGGTGR